MAEARIQQTLADQLAKLRPSIEIKSPDDKPLDSKEVVSDAIANKNNVNTKNALTKEETDRLIQFFEEEKEDDPEIVVSQSAIEILKRLMDPRNAGMHQILEGMGKTVDIWYDKKTEKFFRSIGSEKYPGGFSFNRLGGWLDRHGFSNNERNRKNGQKIAFDTDGNHIKPAEEVKTEAIPVVAEVLDTVIIPVEEAKTESKELIAVDTLVSEKKREVTSIANNDFVVESGGIVLKTKEPSVIEVPNNDDTKKDSVVIQDEVIGKADETKKERGVEDAKEDIETEPFIAKSAELQQLLEQSNLMKPKGQRTDEEMKQLANDIRKAARSIVEGMNVDDAIVSFGLNNVFKVSKTLQQNILSALKAELKSHQLQQNQEEAIAPLVSDEVNNEVKTEAIESVAPVTIEADVVEKEKIVEKGTSVLKDKLFGKDWDEKQAQETQQDEKSGVSPDVAVVQEPVKEKIVLNPELFPVEVSLEKKQLIDEQQEKIDTLREVMVAARKDYALMDYKKTGMIDNVKRFFGKSIFKTLSKDEDKDVIEMQAWYQNAVMDYTNAQMEMEDLISVSEKDRKIGLVAVLKEIEIQEQGVNLYNARTEAKTGNFSEKMLNVLSLSIDSYRNFRKSLPVWQQFALSGGLMGIGAVATFGASAGVAGASAGFWALKVFGAGTSGRGTFDLLETWMKNRENTSKEAEIEKEVETLDIEALTKRLKNAGQNVDKELNKMMAGRSRRTSVAALIGGLPLGMSMYHAGVDVLQAHDIHSLEDVGKVAHGKVSSLFETYATHKEIPPVEVSHAIPQTVIEKAADAVQDQSPIEHIQVAPVAETLVDHIEKPIELVIQQGTHQSIEGQIIKHLIENGIDKAEAGSMAHRMLAVDYMHHLKETGGKIIDFDRILSGKITLSPDSMHIESIEATPMRAMAEHAANIHSKVTESVARVVEHAKAVPMVDPSRIEIPSRPPTDIYGWSSTPLSSATETIGTVASQVKIEDALNPLHNPFVWIAGGIATGTFAEKLTHKESRKDILRNVVYGLSEGVKLGKDTYLSMWNLIGKMTMGEFLNNTSKEFEHARDKMEEYKKYLGDDMPKIENESGMKDAVLAIVKAYDKKEEKDKKKV